MLTTMAPAGIVKLDPRITPIPGAQPGGRFRTHRPCIPSESYEPHSVRRTGVIDEGRYQPLPSWTRGERAAAEVRPGGDGRRPVPDGVRALAGLPRASGPFAGTGRLPSAAVEVSLIRARGGTRAHVAARGLAGTCRLFRWSRCCTPHAF